MDQTNDEELQNVERLLQGLALEVAGERGITLSKVQFDDGRPLGCIDVHILTMGAEGKTVSTKIYQKEVDNFPSRVATELARVKICIAIDRLQAMVNQ